MDKLLDAVLGTVKAVSDSLSGRIEALEKRAPVVGERGQKGDPGERGEKGADGVSGIAGAIGPQGPVGEHGRDGIDGRDGKDADPALIGSLRAEIVELRQELATLKASPPDVSDLVASAVAKAIAAIPTPKDGATGERGAQGPIGPMGPEGSAGEHGRDGIDGLHGKDGAPGEPGTAGPIGPMGPEGQKGRDGIDGKDGVSVASEDVDAMVAAHVERAVKAMPTPKDGQGVTLHDVAPLIAAEVERVVGLVPVPKDGVGLSGAFIDRDGSLVVTLSDGTTKNVGTVVGRDADIDVLKHHVETVLAAWPKPQDGAPGKDGAPGRDGTLENIYPEYDGERTVTWRLKGSGELVPGGVWTFPIPIYRGVYQSGRAYDAWDMTTRGGSMWIAKEATKTSPTDFGDGAKAWMLCVKEGRPGKEGKVGPSGPQGQKGEKGDRWA